MSLGATVAALLVVTFSLGSSSPAAQELTGSVSSVYFAAPELEVPPTTAPTITTAPTTTTTTTPTTTPPPETTTEEPSPEPTVAASSCSTSLAGAQPHVAQVGNHVLTKFDVSSVGGSQGRSGGDHGSGLALDFMVDTATGDALADYVLANQSDFAVKYVIWRQRYNDGSGWSTMEDRGSAPANHYDHVHVSFHGGASVSVTC